MPTRAELIELLAEAGVPVPIRGADAVIAAVDGYYAEGWTDKDLR